MENIQTLLAAVAQTQGFDDDDSFESTPPSLGLQNSISSPEVQVQMGEPKIIADPLEISESNLPPVMEVPAIGATVVKRKRGRPPKGCSMVSKLPPEKKTNQQEDEEVDVVKRKRGRPAKGYMVAKCPPENGTTQQEDEEPEKVTRQLEDEEPDKVTRHQEDKEVDVVKRKRGRPAKGYMVANFPPEKVTRQQEDEEEEDVCFICFDGGSLVLCDRKGCPKAYHMQCIKRDEAFFQTKSKWNCGWHICSVCRKTSHFMCYSCTYSLCKGCIKNADYLCVRGNKGFCSTCMKTIMLIESKDQAKKDPLQVDFDDQTSWEYLFKMYWIYLKDKLSLTLFELTRAVACKPHLSNVSPTLIDGKISEYLEINKLQKDSSIPQNDRFSLETSGTDTLNRAMEQDVPSYNKDAEKLRIDEFTAEPNLEKGTNDPGNEKITDNPDIEKDADNPTTIKDIKTPCYKSGDEPREKDPDKIFNNIEWASQDLLEFVSHMKNDDKSALSQNDLQTLLLDYIDKNNLRDQKGQIICDQMLKNLFGKAHVCHSEMLKLLECHYLKNEDSPKNSFIPAEFVSSSASEMEVVGNKYASPVPIMSRKRKTHKKSKEKTSENNLNQYAAIDFHNINLIYLQRNLMENLIEDKANFSDKVVGSIVRIKISCNDQKPDFHRLVQVVGTSKVAEPYKVGDRTSDIMLEVLNLYKKEEIAIDAISDQEFTEDECRRLRQSIRCGLVKQFTVEEVQRKAMALQPVRLTNLLEVEVCQLRHLIDRAKEEGHNREHRKYLRKLELLKSHEELQRRISIVPEIHADPKMSPDYDSLEDDRSDDNRKIGAYMNSSCFGFTRNKMKSNFTDKKGKEEASIDDASGSRSFDDHMNINSEIDCGNCEAMQRSVLETSTAATSIKNSPSSDDIETERLWHYRDSDGKNKIQGPFSMTELRTWSTTGLLPPDMRIWTNHEQYDSLLLTDALNGQFHGASEGPHNLSFDSPKQGDTGEREGSEDISGTSRDRQAGVVGCDNMSALSERNAENESSSSWPKCWDLLRNHNAVADDVQVLPSSLEETHAVQSDPEQESVEVNHGSENGETNSGGPIHNQMTSEHELQNQSHNQGQILLTYEEILRSLSVDLSSDELETEPVYSPVSDSDDANKQDLEIDVPLKSSGFLELLSPASKSNEDKGGGQKMEKKQIEFPEVANDWFRYSPSPAKPQVQESNSLRHPVVTSENVDTSTSNNNNNQPTNASNIPNWRGMINEPIEFDALGEDSVSDLLAEVAAMESQGGFPSPNSAMKFADELIQDSKDDCFTSIDEFSRAPDPLRNDVFNPTGDIELISQSSMLYKPNIATPNDALNSFTKSVVHSTASSEAEGETNNEPVHSSEADSEFHPPAPNNMTGPTKGAGSGLEAINSPGWGTVQGNINMVTVQGNVTLVLGGPGQEMENVGWETNPGTAWANPRSVKGSLSWDGQRKYGVERFTSPRDRTYQGTSPRDRTYQGTSPRDRTYQGTSPRDRTYQGSGDAGFGKGRPQWSRQQYGGGGGGFSRSLPKGKRVCKFYESGRCRKGGFCDYLHPS